MSGQLTAKLLRSTGAHVNPALVQGQPTSLTRGDLASLLNGRRRSVRWAGRSEKSAAAVVATGFGDRGSRARRLHPVPDHSNPYADPFAVELAASDFTEGSLQRVNYIAFIDSFAAADFAADVRLSPSYPTGRQWYSYYLGAADRFDEAITEMETARDDTTRVVNLERELNPATRGAAIQKMAARNDMQTRAFARSCQRCVRVRSSRSETAHSKSGENSTHGLTDIYRQRYIPPWNLPLASSRNQIVGPS